MVIYKDDILMLRTWRAADAVSLAANADDITLWNNVRDLFPHPYTLTDAREFIAAAAGKPCPVDFAVVAGGKAVGGVGFVPRRPRPCRLPRRRNPPGRVSRPPRQ